MTGPAYPQQSWPPPGPPPARRGRRYGAVIAVVIGLVVVLAAGVTVYVMKIDLGASTDTRTPGTGTTRAKVTPTKRTDARTATGSRTTRTTTAPPRTPTTKPSPRKSPADLLQRNGLYRMPALGDVGCAEGEPADFSTTAGVRDFYSSAMPCLAATWSRLRGADLPFRAARLVVHSGESVSECGARSYSFYCPSEETIFMYAPEMTYPWQEFPTEVGRRNIRLAALHTLAHEYGHHVQYLTGIFGALRSDWPGTEAERELELQATCLGNVFLASQSSAYPISGAAFADEQFWRFITAVPNHGSVGNQDLWSERGYQNRKPGACNTFAAPRAEVT